MKVYVIHHSHTDIGYTERQEKIERYHVDFIHQAIDILNRIHNGEKKEWKGFRWTCENVWQVERFLESADQKSKNDLKKYLETGEIDISGNYLNMTELIDERVLSEKMKSGLDVCGQLGKKVNSAMTADINGYAWGYSEVLFKSGVVNLFSCIHTHHGLFPLNKKQTPFFWRTPNGNKILVWNGDHYHLGNEFIISPNAGHSYAIKDELTGQVHTSQFEVAEKRLFRYINNLEAEGYPFDYFPVMVSGVVTDNSPPSGRIMDFINKWNEKHGRKVELQMSSLHEFFDVVRNDKEKIPEYSGDWNDWWADGVGSTPLVVKHFRDAQRKYQLSHKLDPTGEAGDDKLIRTARDNIMQYAEHTWGYSSSVSEPWATMVNDLELRKSGYAIKANEAISRNLDKILHGKGEVSITPDRDKKYKIINPHDIKIKDAASVYIEYWEYIEEEFFSGESLNEWLEVVDDISGEIIPFQANSLARAREIEVLLELEPHEEKVIKVRKKHNDGNKTAQNHAYVGAEGIEDIKVIGDDRDVKVTTHYIETPFYKILFDEQSGIKNIIDKCDGKEIIKKNRVYDPFTAIYERTDIKTTAVEERRVMGRNRKSMSTNRFASELIKIEIKNTGQLYSIVEMVYQLEGSKHYSVELKAFHHIPKMTVKVRVHKDSYWEPENVYVALPFTTGEEEEFFIEKTGCIIRPGIDQLPYTNKEFYLLQNGLAYISESKGVAIALKDTPLIAMGDLRHHVIELCKENDIDHNQAPVYSWIMNNYWETNFKVDLSGFYEFEYNIYISKDINDQEKAIEKCRTLNEGLIAFNI